MANPPGLIVLRAFWKPAALIGPILSWRRARTGRSFFAPTPARSCRMLPLRARGGGTGTLRSPFLSVIFVQFRISTGTWTFFPRLHREPARRSDLMIRERARDAIGGDSFSSWDQADFLLFNTVNTRDVRCARRGFLHVHPFLIIDLDRCGQRKPSHGNVLVRSNVLRRFAYLPGSDLLVNFSALPPRGKR